MRQKESDKNKELLRPFFLNCDHWISFFSFRLFFQVRCFFAACVCFSCFCFLPFADVSVLFHCLLSFFLFVCFAFSLCPSSLFFSLSIAFSKLFFSRMEVQELQGIKIYNLSSGKTLPQWIEESKKKKLTLKFNQEYRSRIELIQDMTFPVASQKCQVSPDGKFLITCGFVLCFSPILFSDDQFRVVHRVYPPAARIFELDQLAMKVERRFVAEVCLSLLFPLSFSESTPFLSQIVTFEFLTDDYSKVAYLRSDRGIEFHAKFGFYHQTRIPKVLRGGSHRTCCNIHLSVFVCFLFFSLVVIWSIILFLVISSSLRLLRRSTDSISSKEGRSLHSRQTWCPHIAMLCFLASVPAIFLFSVHVFVFCFHRFFVLWISASSLIRLPHFLSLSLFILECRASLFHSSILLTSHLLSVHLLFPFLLLSLLVQSGVNRCRLNPVRGLLGLAGEDGVLECWDPRDQSRCASLSIPASVAASSAELRSRED